MRIKLSLLSIVLVFACTEKKAPEFASTTLFALSAPQIHTSKILFQDTTEIRVDFSFQDAIIKYTLDGTEVTEQSPNYSKPFILSESAMLKAKSYHPDYQESPTNSIQVTRIKENINAAKIAITPEPDAKYQGQGAKSLIDLKKGTLQFSNDAWLGFQEPRVTAHLNFSKAKKVSKIVLSSLANHNSWIFLPNEITILSDEKMVGQLTLEVPAESRAAALHYIEIPIDPNNYTNLKIVVSPLKNIPEWHPGKDTPAWFFMDEILIE